jgi:hypothetical protein
MPSPKWQLETKALLRASDFARLNQLNQTEQSAATRQFCTLNKNDLSLAAPRFRHYCLIFRSRLLKITITT